MQPISKFFFGLLLANILILNLIYVFSTNDSPRSFKTDGTQGLFAKEIPVSVSNPKVVFGPAEPTFMAPEPVIPKQEVTTIKDDEPKNNDDVPPKDEQKKSADEILPEKVVISEQNKPVDKTPPPKEVTPSNEKKVETHEVKKESQPSEVIRGGSQFPGSNPFKLLGGYRSPGPEYYENSRFGQPDFDAPNYHLINDEDYCDRVDSYNLAHPENMFEEKNFFTDIALSHPRKQVIDRIGDVPMKQTFSVFGKGNHKPEAPGKKYHLDVTINNFFVYHAYFYLRHEIGKHFNCATQMYNRIPGHEPLVRKDLSTDNLKRYLQSFGDKTQCHPEGIFPQSYRLYDLDECLEFFSIIGSEKYKKSLETEPLQYLVKVGKESHRSDGVFLLDENKTQTLNENFNFGAKCGVKNESLIAQAYVANPLLLDMDNKFDFRVYMLIVSTNPLIVYYHDGFLRVALSSYNKRSRERGTHLTNTHLAQQQFDKAKNGEKINGMDEKQLMEYHQWTFDELEDYLYDNKKITDRDWLENYLRPAFRKAMIHVVRMAKDSLWKESNVYQLFGLDFMLDDKLKLWFIEGNPNAQLSQGNQKAAELINVMLKDLFEVQYAYYRSRMQRVKAVVEAFNKEQKKPRKVDLQKWSQEYSLAAQNRLESEFPIRKKNTWSLVMDENLPGVSAYQGMVPEGCA